jgi:hypothetical protein
MKLSLDHTWLVTSVLCFFLIACGSETDKSTEANNQTVPDPNTVQMYFESVPAAESGIAFSNSLEETESNNYFTYNYFYNGSGVGVGDINNDGLQDIFFSGNQVPNRLFLNKGDLQFEDITVKAGIRHDNGWSTGVAMVDINADGWLDIYVCRAGQSKNPELRTNLFYLNNKNGTFTESAKQWGIADPGHSTQAYFFDYDRDGDIDLYLVNHRTDFNNNSKIDSEIARDIRSEFSDQLYRNDGKQFRNVSQQAGIVNKAWGLSASIADYNEDGWPDVYVANDFLEPDFLYINQKDGTFRESLKEHFKHISFYGMGSDVADINNDGLMDLMVLDMVASDHQRSKRNMASMSNSNFWALVKYGFHYQYMLNTLQLNNGNGSYSEIAQMAGVSQTDWSWGPLIADFDCDGWQDIFVGNGIKRDVTDNDFKIKVSEINATRESIALDELLGLMPSAKLKNYIFKNKADLTFEKKQDDWGLSEEKNANGGAYADLDNDGDLDLVINNLDEQASIYENKLNSKNYLSLKLLGPKENPNAIGAVVELTYDDKIICREKYPCRGFMSSSEGPIHIGINPGASKTNVKVTWSSEEVQDFGELAFNQIHELKYSTDKSAGAPIAKTKPIFQRIQPQSLGITYRHIENLYDDFIKEILLPHRYSQHGPHISVGDIDGDGYDDFFIGGAIGSPGEIYLQQANSTFSRIEVEALKEDANFEDMGSVLFDADGDGDLDLYVVSGGNEYPAGSSAYQDRFYVNEGFHRFRKANEQLPSINSSGMAVCAGDVDNDGDLDLFVGGRVVPAAYPEVPRSYLLINNEGKFENRTPTELQYPGMITDAVFADLNSDDQLELILSGEWMPITQVTFEGSKIDVQQLMEGSDNGWYQSIGIADVNKDGLLDVFAGNIGLNNKFHPTSERPLHVYQHDFDQNGKKDIVLSKDKGDYKLPVRGRECSSEQMPFIKNKFPTYQAFAEANMEEIYGDELKNALHFTAGDFSHKLFLQKEAGVYDELELSNSIQRSPIMDFLNLEDGRVIYGGNFHMAEVETVRYDAGIGGVLTWKEGLSEVSMIGLDLSGDVKDMAVINLANDGKLLLVAVNNSNPKLYLFK